MEPEILILSAAFFVLAGVMLFYYIKQPKPLRSFLFGSLSGVVSLGLAEFFFSLAGAVLPLNWFSVAFSALLGIPGVITLSVMRIFL